MTFGFRVFETELVLLRRRAPDVAPWLLPDGSHYVELAAKCLETLCANNERLKAQPSWNYGRGEVSIPPYVAHRSDKVVRWTGVNRPAERHLAATLRYGTVGSHANAIGRTVADDTDLGNLAPGNDYRIELLLPSVDGKGLLVVETHGRSCPVEAVPRWLTVVGEIIGGTPATDPASSTALLWKFTANPLIDREHLEQMLAKGQKVELGLRGVAPSGSGVSSGAAVRLQIDVDVQARQALLTGMMEHLRGKNRSPSDLLAAVQLDDTLGDLEYRDGSIRVQDSGGESKTIWLSHITDIFTYPTTKDLPPSDEVWRAAVRAKVGAVRADLEW